MTDFSNQNNTNSAQNYSPWANDYDNPSNNIIKCQKLCKPILHLKKIV